MTQNAPRPAARRTLQDLLRPGIVSGLVLGVCLGGTWALWHGARTDAEQAATAEFDFRVRELVNSIAQRMQNYVQVLYGVQGLYASSAFVDRHEFRTYLAGQDLSAHFPGLQGVGFMRLVPGTQRQAHIDAMRAEGFPDYTVHPAGERPLLAPIVYLEPFTGTNLRAFGYDPMQEPARRAALELARDSGLPAMTAKIKLVQEMVTPGQAGFLVALPVYRNGQPRATLAERRAAIMGWVYAPFRVGDVMAGLGGERAASLDVEIYDGDELSVGSRMYDSLPGPPAPGARQSVQKIGIAGRRWTVRIASLPGVTDDSARDEQVRLTGAAGLLLSGLLATLAWLIARGSLKTRRALDRSRLLAEELKDGQASLLAMAESAHSSQAVLRSILDSTVDGILVDNFQGTVLNSNRRFRELWNVPEQLDWQGDGAILLQHVAGQLVDAAPFQQAGAQQPREN